MGKGSGGTKASSSSAPKGLSGNALLGGMASPQAVSAPASVAAPKPAERVDESIKLIRDTAFIASFGGQWDLETPNADASILLSVDPYGVKRYEVQTIGAFNASGKYESTSPGKAYSDLNAAKKGARELLEDYYKKLNNLK